MNKFKHDPENKVFTKKPEPKDGKPLAIWAMFQDNFGGMDPDVVYFDYEQNLWVIEINGTTNTVNP